MRQQSKEYILILFIVSVMALNYPFLDLFDTAWMPFGIPLLYFYIYLFWFVIIILLIVIVQHSEIRDPDPPPPPPPESRPPLPRFTVEPRANVESDREHPP